MVISLSMRFTHRRPQVFGGKDNKGYNISNTISTCEYHVNVVIFWWLPELVHYGALLAAVAHFLLYSYMYCNLETGAVLAIILVYDLTNVLLYNYCILNFELQCKHGGRVGATRMIIFRISRVWFTCKICINCNFN